MEALYELNKIDFPINKTRKNVGIHQTSFALGDINVRGQKCFQGKSRWPSRFNKEFPMLFYVLKKLMHSIDPEFTYTTIQVNKNVISRPHVDKNNVGPSYIIALGDFTGGNLVIEGVEHNIKNSPLQFDGRLGHWITPFEGTRYSLVFFTHTFKPPPSHLHKIEVKEDGLYKKGVLIKKYVKK